MGYEYETRKQFVFTEDGQVMFLKIRDKARTSLERFGAVRCDALISGLSGDSWDMLACVDRLVEIGDLIEVENPVSRAGQHRLFTHTS